MTQKREGMGGGGDGVGWGWRMKPLTCIPLNIVYHSSMINVERKVLKLMYLTKPLRYGFSNFNACLCWFFLQLCNVGLPSWRPALLEVKTQQTF